MVLLFVSLFLGVSALKLQKCCPRDEMLVLNHSCAPINRFSFDPDQDEYWWLPNTTDISSITPNSSTKVLAGCKQPCSYEETAILPTFFFYNYKIWSDGSVTISRNYSRKTDVRYNASTFCIDRLAISNNDTSNFVMFLCPCQSTLCLYKCCPEGMFLHSSVSTDGTEKIECVENSADRDHWFPKELNVSFHLLYDFPTCKLGEDLVLVNENSNIKFFENGSIQINDEKNLIVKGKYCGEFVVRKEGDSTTRTSQIVRCFPQVGANSYSKYLKRLLYGSLSVIGVLFLVATLIIILLSQKSKNVGDFNLISQTAILLLGYICISISFLAGNVVPHSICVLLGFTTFYSFLSSFFWLNVLCIDLAWTFSELRMIRQISHRRFIYYSLYAWLGPAVIVFSALIADFAPGISANIIKPSFTSRCWFPNDSLAKVAYFYGPISALLLTNVFLFLYTIFKIQFSMRSSSLLVRNKAKDNQSLVLYLKLFFLMGLTWVFEVISWAVSGSDYFWLGTDFVNLFRAVFVFIIVCGKRRIWLDLRERFFNKNRSNSTNVTRRTEESGRLQVSRF